MRELPIPEHMDIFHLTRETEASDMSSLEAGMNCDEERLKLEVEAERLAGQDDGGGEALKRIYERLDALDASTVEKCAAEILNGLDFDKQMPAKKTRDFSGGWRMRIALTRALFMNPTILLLDEPTNHLVNDRAKPPRDVEVGYGTTSVIVDLVGRCFMLRKLSLTRSFILRLFAERSRAALVDEEKKSQLATAAPRVIP